MRITGINEAIGRLPSLKTAPRSRKLCFLLPSSHAPQVCEEQNSGNGGNGGEDEEQEVDECVHAREQNTGGRTSAGGGLDFFKPEG